MFIRIEWIEVKVHKVKVNLNYICSSTEGKFLKVYLHQTFFLFYHHHGPYQNISGVWAFWRFLRDSHGELQRQKRKLRKKSKKAPKSDDHHSSSCPRGEKKKIFRSAIRRRSVHFDSIYFVHTSQEALKLLGYFHAVTARNSRFYAAFSQLWYVMLRRGILFLL